ncbi:partial Ribosomal small subunit pseudouridine synthase A, partial [Rhodocyclaceae bacterium]
ERLEELLCRALLHFQGHVNLRRLDALSVLVQVRPPLAARHARPLDEHRIEIVLEQGKYHQVKRMLAAAGNHCTALVRTAIGGLTLEALGLKEGEWRYLEDAELALLVPDGTGEDGAAR